jgi:para-aminobenzoate synthetase / 4-amino-4-deoxychorismate lyase
VRLLAARSGMLAIELGEAPAVPDRPMQVAVVPLPVDPGDFRLRHKTSDRGFYDEARRASGADEVVFADRDGFLTEGSFTSLFVERDGILFTPPLARGLLPSILRREFIESGHAVEADLTATDLGAPFFIGNSLRGLIPATRVA